MEAMGKLTSRWLVVSIAFCLVALGHSISRAAPPPPQAPPAGSVTGHELVHTNKTVLPNTTVSIIAKCPANKRVVGGGYTMQAGGTTYFNVPTSDGKGWWVSSGNTATTAKSASVWAICVNAVP
jgi:hypothetical protein